MPIAKHYYSYGMPMFLTGRLVIDQDATDPDRKMVG